MKVFVLGLLMSLFSAPVFAAKVAGGDISTQYDSDEAIVAVMYESAEALWNLLSVQEKDSQMFPGAKEKSGLQMHCTKWIARTQWNPTAKDDYTCKMRVLTSGEVTDGYFIQD